MTEAKIVLGRINGLFGVKGWVKIYSYTRPRENILDYPAWDLLLAGAWRRVRIAQYEIHAKGLVARLEGYTDRDQAAELVGGDIGINRHELVKLNEEYYWVDLIGLEVLDEQGYSFGRIKDLMETGANDVMIVEGERERLIPFLRNDVVRQVDLAQKIMIVRWDREF